MQLAASAIFHPRLIAPKVRRWGLEIQHQMYMWLLQPPVILIGFPSRLQVQWPRFGLYEQLDCLLLLCVALWQSLLQLGLVFLEQTSFFRTFSLSFLRETLAILARVLVLLNCTLQKSLQSNWKMAMTGYKQRLLIYFPAIQLFFSCNTVWPVTQSYF